MWSLSSGMFQGGIRSDYCRCLSHEPRECILQEQTNSTTMHEIGAGLSTAIEAVKFLVVDQEFSLQCFFGFMRRFERVGQSSNLYEGSCLASTCDAQRSSLSSSLHTINTPSVYLPSSRVSCHVSRRPSVRAVALRRSLYIRT